MTITVTVTPFAIPKYNKYSLDNRRILDFNLSPLITCLSSPEPVCFSNPSDHVLFESLLSTMFDIRYLFIFFLNKKDLLLY